MNTLQLADGTSISYHDEGSGQPLIFLHGFMGNKEYFAGLIESLKSEYRVIAYDQRCHGLSSGSVKNRTLTGLAEDLKEIIGLLDITKPVLIGESMGGMVILKYVDLFGCGNLKKLVLCDTTPQCLHGENWELGMYLDEDKPLNHAILDEYLLGFNQDYERQMEAFSTATMRGLAPEKMAAINWPPATRELKPDEMLSFFIAIALDSSVGALEKITVPVLLVHSSPGSLFLPGTAEYMQAKIPGARRAVVGTTHLFSLEDPEKYEKELRSFIG